MVVHFKYNCDTLFQLIVGSVSTALLSYGSIYNVHV